MNNKNSMKKSIVLLCVCSIFVLISATPVIGNAATSEEDVTAYFAPELTPRSNFTWKVNEFWGLSDWMIPVPYYDPQNGDLWEVRIIKKLPSLTLDGSISGNISEWYDVDFDATLDIKDYFEFDLSGNDYYDAFGDESNPALNWRNLHQLFLLPYIVEDGNGDEQRFADFYGGSFDGIDGDMDVDTTDGDLRLSGNLTGSYENTTIDLTSNLGVREEFVYKKTQIDTGVTTGIANITLVESEFGPPPKPDIPIYYYVIGGGVLILGISSIFIVRKVRKPTSQTAPNPRDLGPKTKPDPDPSTEPEPEPEDPEPDSNSGGGPGGLTGGSTGGGTSPEPPEPEPPDDDGGVIPDDDDNFIRF